MESLYLLIPLSLIFVAVAVGIFFWAVKSGQYDDLEREGDRILFDNDSVRDESDKHLVKTQQSKTRKNIGD